MTKNNRTRELALRTVVTGLLAATAVLSATGCDEDPFGYDSIFQGTDSFGQHADYDPFGWDDMFSGFDSFGQSAHSDCHGMYLPDRDCY